LNTNQAVALVPIKFGTSAAGAHESDALKQANNVRIWGRRDRDITLPPSIGLPQSFNAYTAPNSFSMPLEL